MQQQNTGPNITRTTLSHNNNFTQGAWQGSWSQPRHPRAFLPIEELPKPKQKNAAKRTRQHARIVFHQKSSSTECCLSPKVVFHWRSSSTEGRLPPKVVFNWRSSSTEGHLPPKVVFLQRSSSTYHNTLVHLIFVRAVSIPNLSFLPAVHDAWCMMHDVTP